MAERKGARKRVREGRVDYSTGERARVFGVFYKGNGRDVAFLVLSKNHKQKEEKELLEDKEKN